MERASVLIVGAQRAGKTYYIENELEMYAKGNGVGVVYKPGRPTDYVGFIEVEIITPEKYKELWERKNRKVMKTFDIPNSVDFFRIKGNEKLFLLKDFPVLLRGKKVKIKRITDSLKSESYLFAAVSKYFYNCLFVIDDCSSVFRNGLSAQMRELASTINHSGGDNGAGQLVGVDIAYIFHSFAGVNPEIYTFINRVVQFKTAFRPKNFPSDVEEIEQIIVENYEYLKKSEKYSRFEYNVHEQENQFFEP